MLNILVILHHALDTPGKKLVFIQYIIIPPTTEEHRDDVSNLRNVGAQDIDVFHVEAPVTSLAESLVRLACRVGTDKTGVGGKTAERTPDKYPHPVSPANQNDQHEYPPEYPERRQYAPCLVAGDRHHDLFPTV